MIQQIEAADAVQAQRLNLQLINFKRTWGKFRPLGPILGDRGLHLPSIPDLSTAKTAGI